MLAHLQATWGVLRAINVLTLQNKPQRYHLYSQVILEYINNLEYSQSKSTRANNPVKYSTLVIIAKNTMLSTDKSLRTNEIW